VLSARVNTTFGVLCANAGSANKELVAAVKAAV
jgi:hypothetical protein